MQSSSPYQPAIRIMDRWSTRSSSSLQLALAMAHVLGPHAHNLEFGFEVDGDIEIPRVTAGHSYGRIMSLQCALQIGQALSHLLSGPVHFHELRATSVTFYVFTPELHPDGETYAAHLQQEYGVPLSSWSLSVQDAA